MIHALVLVMAVLTAGGAAAQGRLSFVQLGPDDEPLTTFEAPCGAARCFGAARLEGPDGPVWIEAAAAVQGGLIQIALRDDAARISTEGAVVLALRGGRAAETIALVRDWWPGRPRVQGGAWNPPPPAGIRLRVAYGP